MIVHNYYLPQYPNIGTQYPSDKNVRGILCKKGGWATQYVTLWIERHTSNWKINSTRVIHKVAQTRGLSLIEIGDKMRIQDENSTIEIKWGQISFVT
jgi:hypothetical protein